MARTPTWRLAALLALIPMSAEAQRQSALRWVGPAVPEVAAFTLCANGQTVTFVNAGVLDSDSLAEIMAHERRHQKQLQSRRACTDPDSGPEPIELLLADEIDGYCASLPYAERRGIPRGERIGQHAGRLFRHFGGRVPVGLISARLRACPDSL